MNCNKRKITQKEIIFLSKINKEKLNLEMIIIKKKNINKWKRFFNII